MKKSIFIICSLLMLFQTSYSQTKFWKNIKVRKAFETNTENDDQPANLLFTLPKDTTNFFVINAGIGYEFSNSSKESKDKKIFKNSFTGFLGYNRNSQIKKEQKNYKLGISSNQIFYTNTDNSTAIFGVNTIEYLRDYCDTVHSFLLTSYWHPFSKKQKALKLDGYAQNDKLFAYNFLPQIGLEYQNKFEAKESINEGYDFRGFFSLGVNLLLKKKTYDDNATLLPVNRWTKGIELKVAYDGRVSLIKNIDNQDSYIPIFKSELIWYPTQDNRFSIGFSYNNGANPVDGMEEQTFWLLALKFIK